MVDDTHEKACLETIAPFRFQIINRAGEWCFQMTGHVIKNDGPRE